MNTMFGVFIVQTFLPSIRPLYFAILSALLLTGLLVCIALLLIKLRAKQIIEAELKKEFQKKNREKKS